MTSSDRAARRVTEINTDGSFDRDDLLIAEVPCELRYNGSAFAVMMMTPTDLRDFAVGFSLSEGIVSDLSKIGSIVIDEYLEGISIDVTATLVSDIEARLIPGRSGCGLCGASRLEDALHLWPAVADSPTLDASALQASLHALNGIQPLNEVTGAAHAAAWATLSGEIVLVREDVGRHNAVDKLMGALVQTDGFDPTQGFVLVTSRASYEIVNKCLRFGVPHLAAMSAPTALAVDVARAGNMNLVAFLRDNRYVSYS